MKHACKKNCNKQMINIMFKDMKNWQMKILEASPLQLRRYSGYRAKRKVFSP